MTTNLLDHVDEMDLHEVVVDAALILDQTFDLRPAGWDDDEDGYDRADDR